MNKSQHIPVMLDKTIEILDIKPDKWYIDTTFGQGGHSAEILSKKGLVVAFDYDQNNIESAQQHFSQEIENERLILIRENFDQLKNIINQLQAESTIAQIYGILFDFGTTSEQLMSEERGLSFQGKNDELDMRLDERLGVKARDLLAIMDHKQLQKIFEVFGGETEAKSIAKEITKRRKNKQFITTVQQLQDLITQTKHHSSPNIHPATKVFQALRIAVNDELGSIERALPQALELIEPDGKIVTIAFHEGEDRIIKSYFREWEKRDLGIQGSKKVIKPTDQEVSRNQKSRSAKLRSFRKKSA
jgi:16S rRNA (cytosine1402-N4)-methyltransferase